MPPGSPPSRRRPRVLRAMIEIVFIMFLFYSNLLMGEFDRAAGRGKTLAVAIDDIFTPANFIIGLSAALVGYLIFEFLRRRL
jgi:hypothetical protein